MIEDILKNRVLVLDGAMGTMIQKYSLSEEDFRGERFINHNCDLKGNNDLLSITQPQIIKKIHEDKFWYRPDDINYMLCAHIK